MASKIFCSGGKLDSESLGQIAEVMDDLFGTSSMKHPGTTILENLKNMAQKTNDQSSQDHVVDNLLNMMFSSKPSNVVDKHDYDIIDNNNDYIIVIDVPGCRKEDNVLNINDNSELVIRSECKSTSDKFLVHKRKTIRESVIRLPDDIDRKNVSAKYENGTLIVTVGKKNSAPLSGHKIEIF